jgi:hypothetical protein
MFSPPGAPDSAGGTDAAACRQEEITKKGSGKSEIFHDFFELFTAGCGNRRPENGRSMSSLHFACLHISGKRRSSISGHFMARNAKYTRAP